MATIFHVHSRCASLVVILFLFSNISASQQPGESIKSSRVAQKPTGVLAPDPSKATAPIKGSGKVVDLKQKVLFSLTLGKENLPQVDYKSRDNQVSRVPTADKESIKKIIESEFKDPNSPDGVVIRVAKNVKYDMVDSLFKSIRSAMKESQIDKPVYISVEDPKVQDDPDEMRTQEFICKNQKAADLYDRVSNVARVFKVSVRLDPARNSITAKGASSKVTAIQNLIKYLDKPAGESPKAGVGSTTPKKGANDAPKKSNTDAAKKKTESKGNNGAAKIQPAIPKTALPKINESSLPDSSSTVGRYQLSGVGNSLFLLDTASGECWFLDITGADMRWMKLPHPKENR